MKMDFCLRNRFFCVSFLARIRSAKLHRSKGLTCFNECDSVICTKQTNLKLCRRKPRAHTDAHDFFPNIRSNRMPQSEFTTFEFDVYMCFCALSQILLQKSEGKKRKKVLVTTNTRTKKPKHTSDFMHR